MGTWGGLGAIVLRGRGRHQVSEAGVDGGRGGEDAEDVRGPDAQRARGGVDGAALLRTEAEAGEEQLEERPAREGGSECTVGTRVGATLGGGGGGVRREEAPRREEARGEQGREVSETHAVPREARALEEKPRAVRRRGRARRRRRRGRRAPDSHAGDLRDVIVLWICERRVRLVRGEGRGVST